MPVLVHPERCPCANPCYPSKVCPYDVLHFDFVNPTRAATLDPTLCNDCRGVCTNFCDPRALLFAPTMEELRLLEAELHGTMTAEEIAAERKRIKEEAERKKHAVVLEVTTATFEAEVLRAALPVVLDCWAPWSEPCKTFAPIFAQAAQEYAGKLKFCKVNTDTEQSIAQALRIQSIPTLFFFFKGQVLGALPGALSAAQLRTAIEQVLRTVASAPAAAAAGSTPRTPAERPVVPPTRVQRGRQR